MSKNQDISSVQFEDLPDEMILQVLNNLDLNDLANCVMVSKRIRGICKNLSKFQKINLYNKVVPSGFVQLVLNSGCKYLSLYWAQILQGDNELKLEKPCKLRYLDLSDCKCRTEDIEEILSSCYFLEKLTLDAIMLTPNMIKSICLQNSQTLETLSLTCCRGLDLGKEVSRFGCKTHTDFC